MISNSNKLRLRRLFASDGRSVMIALDHLSRIGAGVRLREPDRILREVEAAGVDAVLLRAGVARRCRAALGRTSLVLSHPRDLPATRDSVELALRLGADAIKIEALPGSPTEPDSLARLAAMAIDCERWALPLIAEMIPVGFGAKEHHTPEKLCDVARLGSDLGADVIKIEYTGERESFGELVALAGSPVLILGGSRVDIRALLQQVHESLEAGASGVAIGRSVWASERPGHVAAALVRLVHERIPVDVALAAVERVSVAVPR